MNIFERAARAKLRFETPVGLLTTEQLWELPLTSRGDRLNLDVLARGVNRELKSRQEESFVDLKPDALKTELELKLDLLKHVIESKLADKAAAEKAVVTAERKRKLLAALASKEEAELTGLSREEIEREIAALGAA